MAEDFDRDKIIEKIKKLLALAESSNENEAALAAERVQDLLAKYNLTHMDLKEEVDEEFVTDADVEVRTDVGGAIWQRPLRSAVARLYFCMHFYTACKRPMPGKTWTYTYDRHSYVGAPHNVIVAKLMSDFLVDTVLKLAKETSKIVPEKDRGKFRISFCNAATSRLNERLWLKYLEATSKPQVAGEGNMLALYDETAAKLKDVYNKLDLRDTKQKLSANDLLGNLAGLKAGDEIGLETQLEGTKASGFLLPSS